MVTQTPRIFAQEFPVIGIDTNLYTLNTGHNAQLTIFIANQSNLVDRVNIALVASTDSGTTARNYIAYQTQILGNGVLAFSGIYLNEGDQIRVLSSNGTTSFVATGIDIIP